MACPIDIEVQNNPSTPIQHFSTSSGFCNELSSRPEDSNLLETVSTDSSMTGMNHPFPSQETNPPSDRVGINNTETSDRGDDMLLYLNQKLSPLYRDRMNRSRTEAQPPPHGSEEDQLLQKGQRPRRHRRTCCMKRCCLCTAVAVVCCIIMLILGVSLVTASSVSADFAPVEVMKSDYVLLNIDIDFMMIRQLLFSIVLTSNDTSVPIDVYKVKCNELVQYERSHFINDAPSRHYFNNCSQYFGFCPITQYFYQVRSTHLGSVLTYKFSISPFIGDPSLDFLGYNDEYQFHKFLIGKGNEEAIYTRAVDFPLSTFSFSVDDMRKDQSYYFFALEIVKAKHVPDWYEVTRTGIHVTYEGLETTDPFCTISSNTTCRVPLPINSYCFVVHSKDDNVATNDVIVEAMLTLSTEGKVTGYLLIVASLTTILTVVVFHVCRLRRR